MSKDAQGRIYNFSAGPATLPVAVLERARDEMLNWNETGMSVMEMSHRSAGFESIINTAEADLRALFNIPENYAIMFQQGGATLQFTALAMNLRPADKSADYIVNGAWGKAAVKEAEKLGQTRIAATTEAGNFSAVPDAIDCDPNAAYLHFTSNETIHGVEWMAEPNPPVNVPLVCDMSSDFASRPVDVTKYAMIYAGAQKNVGPSGVTMVILRKDLLERTPAKLPIMLDYKIQAENKSLYNTPPCYSIYMVGLVLQWLKSIGGLPEIAKRNEAKSKLIYDAIDNSGGFYKGHAAANCRSHMNVTFRLPNEDLEKKLVKEATAAGLDGLKGHRSVGGLRASIYNAMPHEGAATLAQFMQDFQKKNG